MSTPQNPYQNPYQNPPQPKRLLRSTEDKMVAGVCGGIARYLNVDPTLVRVVAVIALVVAFPAALIGYVVAWAITPVAG